MRQYELLYGLQSLLEYHRNSGISHYPKDKEISRFLHSLAELRDGPPSPQARTGQVAKTLADHEVVGVPLNFQQPAVSLADIAEEVAQCRACSLAENRMATRAGLGDDRARLLIVGDWLTGGEPAVLSEEVQFGIEEDRMLFRMLAAINVQAEQTFITNAIKCVIPETTQPLAENVKICLSFLHRQIALLAPECICTMGMLATRALLGLPQPLSQLRGSFHSFKADDGRQIPLIATYHPSFLLQNPEMKKAVWFDLQSIGRQMKTFP